MTNPLPRPTQPGVLARGLALLVLIACAAAAWLDGGAREVTPLAARSSLPLPLAGKGRGEGRTMSAALIPRLLPPAGEGAPMSFSHWWERKL